MAWSSIGNVRGGNGATGPTGPEGPVRPHMPLVYFVTVPPWSGFAALQNAKRALRVTENHLSHARDPAHLAAWTEKHKHQVARIVALEKDQKAREAERARSVDLENNGKH